MADPIQDLTVTAYRKKDDSWVNAGSATTDENGEYEITGLWDGEYVIKVSDDVNNYWLTIYLDSGPDGLPALSDVGTGKTLSDPGITWDVFMYSGLYINGTIIG